MRVSLNTKKTSQILIVPVISIALLAIAGIALFSNSNTNTANAVTAADWDPGYIIDDGVFYNSEALTPSEIQAFLESKMPNCDTSGSQPAWDFGRGDITRAQYAASQGWHAPPYTCLRDYKQNTPQMEAGSGLCSAMSAKSNQKASQIISDVARACHINPQVLLVLLQKEQSLVTDTWPLKGQYRNATGFACPDTAPCDPAYEGFFYQVYYAARQFQIYKKYPDDYNYKAGRNNNIYYNPDLGRCGSSSVYIQNQATAALYIYTPYQPNQSALNNMYGTGDSCGSYGNRNFWRLFSDWFGSTKLGIVKLDSPRWMEIKKNTQKMHLVTGENFGPILPTGQQIFFPDKFYMKDQWYLRTKYDKTSGNKDGIPLNDLREIPIQPIQEKWMSVKNSTTKIDPVRETSFETVDSMIAMKVKDSITVNGKTYYRTTWESEQNRPRFLPANDIESFKFYDFINPRILYTKKDTPKLNVQTGATVSNLPANTYLMFDKRITIGGVLYVQAVDDHGTNHAIRMDELEEVTNLPFVKLSNPRWMKIKVDTYKVHLPSEESFDPLLVAGREIYFPDKVLINGTWYLRTQWDKDNGRNDGIPLDQLAEI